MLTESLLRKHVHYCTTRHLGLYSSDAVDANKFVSTKFEVLKKSVKLEAFVISVIGS